MRGPSPRSPRVPGRPGSRLAARKKFQDILGAGQGVSRKLNMSLGDMCGEAMCSS